MHLARVRTPDGVVTGEYDDGVVMHNERAYEVGEDATLLAPSEPSTFYCVGRNYAKKIEQMSYEIPDEPDFFIKPAVSLHHPNQPIPYPSFTNDLTYAGELAAVIGEECHDITPAEIPDVVHGYTILNDLDALDQPRRTARKAFDGSAPLGPVIATDVDPANLAMETKINGETRQEDHTENMLFDPLDIVAFLSERFTFKPGDVISFGSPANPGGLEPGDEIEIWYEGIGTLRNTVESS
ncbi:fumarylacetoacetate hydrolase family protein [Haladaptatus sp. DJG-WS-42]|uniref:fumarylacetoacetate hydrolase family protein n=1 Tax=Haladaptatus sp. DJG-WS-42 TaxID=3120516 RepID=UPI0030D30534